MLDTGREMGETRVVVQRIDTHPARIGRVGRSNVRSKAWTRMQRADQHPDGRGPAAEPRRFLDGAYDFSRSAERRVGTECVSTCRSQWSPDNLKKKKHNTKMTRHKKQPK